MNMMEELYELCLDNDFDEVEQEGSTLTCGIRSFDNRYRLEAVGKEDRIELALADSLPLAVTPEVSAFLQKHGETGYPLRRTVRPADVMQDVLDDLQSAADDLFGFAHDLAEKRHSAESAESALKSNFDLRDTPQEIAQLDGLAAGEMRAKRTLWYPSADRDFRDLVFCSGEYPGIDISPELFVHTDCKPNFDLDAPGIVYEDAHTRVTLHKEREFDRLSVPHGEFAHWDSKEAGRIILYQAEIVSDRFGKIDRPLIYAVCENEWLAAEFLVPNRIAVETVCHVRYGSGFGGASATGAWLVHALKLLHSRHFISDPMLTMQSQDEAVLRKYPQLAGVPAELVPGTVIPGKLWSDHGDVTVYDVR